ncbi:hypothetical protein Tco_1210491 [Tanacetum coccineum]
MRLARLLHQEAFGFPERHVGRSKADCYIHFKEFGNISVVIGQQAEDSEFHSCSPTVKSQVVTFRDATDRLPEAGMAMIAILQERVPEGLCNFSSLMHLPGHPKMSQPLKFKGTDGVLDSLSAAHANAMEDTEKEMNRQILPNGEIKKLEFKELNFEGEGNRCVTYTNVSQELAQCGDRMFSRRNRTKAFQEGLVLKLEEQQQPGNRVGNAKAQAKVYAVGNAGPNPDNNVVTGSRVFNEGMSRILSKFSATKTKTSQMGKLIKDVPVVQEFPEVFFP